MRNTHNTHLLITAESNLQITKMKMSMMTIVEPTGVPATIDARIPVIAPNTDMEQEETITFLKLLKSNIAETEGKMIRAEIKREPTRFIASTMITAMTAASMTFKKRVFVPHANAKSSSKVMAKILL